MSTQSGRGSAPFRSGCTSAPNRSVRLWEDEIRCSADTLPSRQLKRAAMDDLVEFLTGGTSLLALAAELDEADDELAAAEHRNQLLRRTFASEEEKAVLDFGLRSRKIEA